MRAVGYVWCRQEPGVVRIMSVHSSPLEGVLLPPGKPPSPISLTHLPDVTHIAEYGALTGQGQLETLCLAPDTPDKALLEEDLTGALIARGYVSPIITERRCRIHLTSRSVLPFVLDAEEEVKWRSGERLRLVLAWEKEQIQPGVAYPIEVAPQGGPVQYRGPYEETTGLDYGVLTLTRNEPAAECVGLLRLVEERDGEKLPPSLALYRFGRPVGRAELL